MNLDNKGWGLQELIMGLGILFFCLLLIVSLINRNFRNLPNKNQNSTNQQPTNQNKPVEENKDYTSYQEIETSMKKAAEKYKTNIYGNELQEGDSITVTLHSLIQNHYLEEVHDIKDKNIICSGYVTFRKNENQVTYRPYLKCGKKYKTKGYLERLDVVIE